MRTKVGTHAQIKGRSTTVTKFWARSARWGEMGGSKVSPTPEFFCKQYEMTFRQLRNGRFSPNLAIIICKSWVKRRCWTNLWKVSIQGSFAPKTPNLEGVKQTPHSEQATGQGMHCRKILFTPRCSPKGQWVSEASSTFLYNVQLRSYGASKLPNFRILAYFPHIRRLKTYLPVTSLQPRDYIVEWLPLIFLNFFFVRKIFPRT